MKKVAPTAARFIRDHVNSSNIGQIIAFASMAGLALPGIAQGLASLLGGGDQEDKRHNLLPPGVKRTIELSTASGGSPPYHTEMQWEPR
jgi:hypothetical protein